MTICPLVLTCLAFRTIAHHFLLLPLLSTAPPEGPDSGTYEVRQVARVAEGVRRADRSGEGPLDRPEAAEGLRRADKGDEEPRALGKPTRPGSP